jgi:prevent-host-death family protein
MSEVALFEAKNKLSGLLDRVAEGEEFIITRHGKPAARLTPVQPAFDRAKARQAVRMLLQARKGITLGGLSIKELVNEGRP